MCVRYVAKSIRVFSEAGIGEPVVFRQLYVKAKLETALAGQVGGRCEGVMQVLDHFSMKGRECGRGVRPVGHVNETPACETEKESWQ